jgi:hypothetical protein
VWRGFINDSPSSLMSSLSIHLIFDIMSVPPNFAGLKLPGASQETPHTLEMCMSSQGSSYRQTS